MLKHRNSQKRIIFQDACYFITVKTFNNFPYFKESIFCPPGPKSIRTGDLFMENLRLYKQIKGFLLYGWVLIYDHFHLMVQPEDDWSVSDVMFSIKKQFSHNVNRVMGFNKIPVNPEGGQALVRLHVCGILHHDENWLYINKFDQYVQKLKNQFQQKYQNNHPFPKFQWKESFHDHYIRNENDFDYHMEYIAYNPTKHGLPVNWPYVYTRPNVSVRYGRANPEYEDLTEEI